MVNVVNREDIIDTLQQNQIRNDLNGDAKEDIILWDSKQIWIKYADPEKDQSTTRFTRLYRTPSFESPSDLADEVRRGGWLNVAGSTFKLRDEHTAPQGFNVAGQSFDTITLGWDNNSAVGYVVQLTDKVHHRFSHALNRSNTKYVLVLASGTNLDGLFLYDELLGGQKRVSDLINNGSVLRVTYFDSNDDTIGLTLTDLPRAWQYLSVAKLGSRSLGRTATLLEKNSARSHQEAAGIQAAGDNL